MGKSRRTGEARGRPPGARPPQADSGPDSHRLTTPHNLRNLKLFSEETSVKPNQACLMPCAPWKRAERAMPSLSEEIVTRSPPSERHAARERSHDRAGARRDKHTSASFSSRDGWTVERQRPNPGLQVQFSGCVLPGLEVSNAGQAVPTGPPGHQSPGLHGTHSSSLSNIKPGAQLQALAPPDDVVFSGHG
eukprot:2443140-Rhodomonas_salina.1